MKKTLVLCAVILCASVTAGCFGDFAYSRKVPEFAGGLFTIENLGEGGPAQYRARVNISPNYSSTVAGRRRAAEIIDFETKAFCSRIGKVRSDYVDSFSFSVMNQDAIGIEAFNCQ